MAVAWSILTSWYLQGPPTLMFVWGYHRFNRGWCPHARYWTQPISWLCGVSVCVLCVYCMSPQREREYTMGKPGSSHLRDPPLISEDTLKSEAVLIKYLSLSDIRDTLPIHFTASEIRGIRCLCFQRHVSDFIDMSLISETSRYWNIKKLFITLPTQEIWNLFFQIIVT